MYLCEVDCFSLKSDKNMYVQIVFYHLLRLSVAFYVTKFHSTKHDFKKDVLPTS